MSTAFDTLSAARDMEAAGMDRRAAEAVAYAIRAGQGELATRADLDALRTATKADLGALRTATKADLDALRADLDTLRAATKEDLAALRAATKVDLDALRTATKADLAALEARLTWRIVGLVIAANAALVATMKLIP